MSNKNIADKEHKHHHDHHGCEHEHHHDHCGCEHEHHHDHCSCEHEHHRPRHEHHEELRPKKHGTAAKTAVIEIENLDCPHCASMIEKEVEKTDGVQFARMNLINGKLTVGLSDDFGGDIYKLTAKAVKKYEPQASVVQGSAVEKKSLIKTITDEKAVRIRFYIGAPLFALGFILHLIDINISIYMPILVISYIILGCDVIYDAVRNIFTGRLLDEKFLMTVSTVGAFVIGEYPEAVAVMLFYQIGEFFQTLAVKRSRRSISDLMDIRPDSANLVKGSEVVTVSPDDVLIGDIILIKPGEKIPLDGEIIDGETLIDTRALTGESVPRKAKTGDSVLSGCINESGAVKVRVTKEYGESTAAKILDLVENSAGRKAPTENFISVFARYYTPIVVALALIIGMIPPLLTGDPFSGWVRRSFVFLVISCPCALVLSIPLTFFGGIGAASKRGVLIKGSNYLEALSMCDSIMFDKTGTLTKGVFKVTKISPADGVTEEELLLAAAAAEKLSNHPIARSVIEAYPAHNNIEVTNYIEITGMGVSAEYEGKKILAGSARLMQSNDLSMRDDPEGTVVHVAEDKKYLGYLIISDEIKESSAKAISELRDIGVNKIIMLTGDNETTAKAVANEIGITDVHAALLPAQKVEIVERAITDGSGKLAFVGDGINDAPVLARADIGIAMGALGSDAAIEAADIVLMNDEPAAIADAVRIARRTKHLVTQNIILILIVKIVILALGALGLAGMWAAVFGDVGIMIIAVLNSTRILK